MIKFVPDILISNGNEFISLKDNYVCDNDGIFRKIGLGSGISENEDDETYYVIGGEIKNSTKICQKKEVNSGEYIEEDIPLNDILNGEFYDVKIKGNLIMLSNKNSFVIYDLISKNITKTITLNNLDPIDDNSKIQFFMVDDDFNPSYFMYQRGGEVSSDNYRNFTINKFNPIDNSFDRLFDNQNNGKHDSFTHFIPFNTSTGMFFLWGQNADARWKSSNIRNGIYQNATEVTCNLSKTNSFGDAASAFSGWSDKIESPRFSYTNNVLVITNYTNWHGKDWYSSMIVYRPKSIPWSTNRDSGWNREIVDCGSKFDDISIFLVMKDTIDDFQVIGVCKSGKVYIINGKTGNVIKELDPLADGGTITIAAYDQSTSRLVALGKNKVFTRTIKSI